MNLLIIHRGFPGQFKHILNVLVSRGDYITCIIPSEKQAIKHELITYIKYELRRGNGKDTHELAIETESKVLRGEAVAMECKKLSESGYKPDIILGHPGWGEMLFIKDIWPDCPQLHYVEYAYMSSKGDLDFLDNQGSKASSFDKMKARMKNANVLLNLESMNWGITPTIYQFDTIPKNYQHKISIIHDGINTNIIRPDKSQSFTLKNGRMLKESDNVVTFVNRTFEPYRGVHIFMKALPKILNDTPNCNVVMVGTDSPKVSYGANRTDGKGWLSHLKEQMNEQIDWNRVHIVGKIPHSELIKLYQVSSAHVYLTYPFVLSWSLLEAMSAGCLVICSDTEPVKEMVQNNKNGLLFEFSDYQELSSNIKNALSNKEKYAEIRQNARRTITENYSLEKTLFRQIKLIESVACRCM